MCIVDVELRLTDAFVEAAVRVLSRVRYPAGVLHYRTIRSSSHSLHVGAAPLASYAPVRLPAQTMVHPHLQPSSVAKLELRA